MLRWMVIIATLVYLADSLVAAQPMINDDPKVKKVLKGEMFEFVSKTLATGKLAEHLICTIKTRSSRELRKFSSGKEWVETLEIDYSSNGFDSGRRLNIKIPDIAKYGVKKSGNTYSGLAEKVKIELGDYYDHWIEFTHDGQGTITQLLLGNNLYVAPCQTR
ncbi:hypothetical protein [Bdellovibrio reynosensis]|uniref:Uncharacterized protein n=1 Tax=Bdellovibrio reynosensis TaxID=2835041 RepID=A0ABY4C4X7_9BACT|nr:hypothetical protein [Bdellovibrio reynosensis]UOE99954.1 hypothetical protein MNR06_09610 [Bdellovibrio reynosensis]